MKKLKTEIYADGANIKEIFEANNNKKSVNMKKGNTVAV